MFALLDSTKVAGPTAVGHTHYITLRRRASSLRRSSSEETRHRYSRAGRFWSACNSGPQEVRARAVPNSRRRDTNRRERQGGILSQAQEGHRSVVTTPKQGKQLLMKLSRTVAYAIQATLQLARSQTGQPVPCSQLAAEGHMPERFLLQILRSLVIHGVLHSTRGVDGGYVLNRKPNEISLLEVIEAIDGPLNCSAPQGGEGVDYEPRLREVLVQLTNSARDQLSSVKLSDLMKTSV